jgi:hypothetical protein
MRMYGGLMNRLMEGPSPVKPKVGMGVTICWWSDRTAGTISRVSPSGKTFWFKDDTAIRTDNNGISEQQEYRYEQCPDAPEEQVRMTKNGWRTVGSKCGVHLGYRKAYTDPTF